MRDYAWAILGIAVGAVLGFALGSLLYQLLGAFSYLPIMLAVFGSYIGMISGERWRKSVRAARERKDRR